MTRGETLRRLAANRAVWEGFGVERLKLFGSVARDQARPESDIDLLVEFRGPYSLLDLIRLRRRLSDLLEAPVDLGTPQSLRPAHRERILAEAIDVA